jgi:hypothetical protein
VSLSRLDVKLDRDVDLVIRESTPPELSTKSVLMRPPAIAYSMRPSCESPRLPPSPTTLQRSSRPSTRTPSLARSPIAEFASRAALT